MKRLIECIYYIICMYILQGVSKLDNNFLYNKKENGKINYISVFYWHKTTSLKKIKTRTIQLLLSRVVLLEH